MLREDLAQNKDAVDLLAKAATAVVTIVMHKGNKVKRHWVVLCCGRHLEFSAPWRLRQQEPTFSSSLGNLGKFKKARDVAQCEVPVPQY